MALLILSQTQRPAAFRQPGTFVLLSLIGLT